MKPPESVNSDSPVRPPRRDVMSIPNRYIIMAHVKRNAGSAACNCQRRRPGVRRMELAKSAGSRYSDEYPGLDCSRGTHQGNKSARHGLFFELRSD